MNTRFSAKNLLLGTTSSVVVIGAAVVVVVVSWTAVVVVTAGVQAVSERRKSSNFQYIPIGRQGSPTLNPTQRMPNMTRVAKNLLAMIFPKFGDFDGTEFESQVRGFAKCGRFALTENSPRRAVEIFRLLIETLISNRI